MDQFLQQLVNGLAIGGIYALVALGYTMVYGVLKLIIFAHGDLFTIGAYLGMTLFVSLGLAGKVPAWAAVTLVAVMVMGLVRKKYSMPFSVRRTLVAPVAICSISDSSRMLWAASVTAEP